MAIREPDPDANEDTARVLREATADEAKLPANLEAEWSKGIKGCDERGL